MEENEYHNIYIQNEEVWKKAGQNKFGYTGPKKNSLVKRKHDSHEQHSYLKKIVTAFKIFITFYDLVYKEFDEIIKIFLYKPEIIEELEKHYNCEFTYGRLRNMLYLHPFRTGSPILMVIISIKIKLSLLI